MEYGRISIHRPLAGPDIHRHLDTVPDVISIHRPLAGPDVVEHATGVTKSKFQSTGPSRGPTNLATSIPASFQISIHRPLAGPDTNPEQSNNDRSQISIHRPLAGPDHGTYTRPARIHISIHRPLAGPDVQFFTGSLDVRISIHRPLAGPDSLLSPSPSGSGDFNPQAPRGARQRPAAGGICRPSISIHRPLAGPDGFRGTRDL